MSIRPSRVGPYGAIAFPALTLGTIFAVLGINMLFAGGRETVLAFGCAAVVSSPGAYLLIIDIRKQKGEPIFRGEPKWFIMFGVGAFLLLWGMSFPFIAAGMHPGRLITYEFLIGVAGGSPVPVMYGSLITLGLQKGFR